MNERMLGSSPGAVPLGHLLSRMARELRGLESVVDDLQALVGRLTLARSEREGETISQLQQFDQLAQTIVAIAGFAEALADDVPAAWSLDPNAAARVVLLASLAERLVSGLHHVSDATGSGELEMF